MAEEDLDILRGELPNIFKDHPIPDSWEEDWLFIPIDDPESEATAEESDLQEVSGDTICRVEELEKLPPLGTDTVFAGSPIRTPHSSQYPPTDSLAFYLPIHHYHPVWWGVYLTFEGVALIRDAVVKLSQSLVPPGRAWTASRLFLYFHEAFHHQVEYFGIRLEVTHRRPLYITGFTQAYAAVVGGPNCLEEALANGHALREVKRRIKGAQWPKPEQDATMKALREIVQNSPPSYCDGIRYEDNSPYKSGRCVLAEDYHHAATSATKLSAPSAWLSFPHAFSGINKINGRANYVVHRSSPLIQRLPAHLRPI